MYHKYLIVGEIKEINYIYVRSKYFCSVDNLISPILGYIFYFLLCLSGITRTRMLATQKHQISSKKLHIHTVFCQILRNGGNTILLVLRCCSLIKSTGLPLNSIFYLCVFCFHYNGSAFCYIFS